MFRKTVIPTTLRRAPVLRASGGALRATRMTGASSSSAPSSSSSSVHAAAISQQQAPATAAPSTQQQHQQAQSAELAASTCDKKTASPVAEFDYVAWKSRNLLFRDVDETLLLRVKRTGAVGDSRYSAPVEIFSRAAETKKK